MKNNLNAYELYLSAHLSRHNYPEAEDRNFIIARADQALDVFCEARRGGVEVLAAQELALTCLMQDFELSFDDVLRSILEEQFGDRIPEYEHDIVIADMEDTLEEYRDIFNADEYSNTFFGMELRYELIDIIDQYLTSNGL